MIKIIVLAGSFNPVTRAHFEILSDAVEKYHADEGVFVLTSDKYLAKKNILKNHDSSGFMLSEDKRTAMLNSLKEENPKLSFWGIEMGGAAPNTYKTLLKILKDKKKQYQSEDVQLYYLFGADKMKNMPRWQDADKMIDLCEYLVYARQFDLESVISADPFLREHREKIHLMTVENDDLEDVSSTEVRRKFFAGEDYSQLMNDGPCKILKEMSPADFSPVTPDDIIKAHILYGGQFGKGAARMQVYKSNKDLFEAWSLPGLGDREAHRQAKAYDKEFHVDVPKQQNDTATACVNADCADVAENLIKEGYHPAILNLASRTSPCGGYHKGTSAQEESLSQMSTLSQSLYQFGNPKYKHIRESGLSLTPGVYPMDINFGGIYSPSVTFFRHNIDKYYSLRDTTFDCPIVTVASLSNREKNEYTNDERIYFNNDGYLTDDGRTIEINKIRTILRIALDNGHDSMVLGAFGCGVYHLKSDEVSTLFKDVLEEPEFKNRFKKIVFAIYEGKPTKRNPNKGKDGQFKPFYDVFGMKV